MQETYTTTAKLSIIKERNKREERGEKIGGREEEGGPAKIRDGCGNEGESCETL